MLSMRPLKMVNQIENGMSMRTLDESACLSKIDDLEIDRYLHKEEERQYKKLIWEKLNQDYLKDQAAKEAASQKVLDASASVTKSQKGKRKRQAHVVKGSGSVQPDPKATQALRKKRLSSKVNLERLDDLFSESDMQATLDNPKGARIEPFSENHENVESELGDQNRGDDELEYFGEFDEETNVYENTYDNNVDEGYNYEDDDYNF